MKGKIIENLGIDIQSDAKPQEQGSFDHWVLRKKGTEDQFVTAVKNGTGEMFILAFRSEEEADGFLIDHSITDAEVIFMKKDTKQ